MKIRKRCLCKYNYTNYPESCKSGDWDKYKGMTFFNHGKVAGMKGHSFVQNIDTGICYVLSTDSLIELTEDEL